MYEEYKKNNGEKASWFTRLFNQNQRWLRVCEFVVCFLAFEFLQRLLGNQAQFKMIDLRLVFIVLFGSLYGLGYGIAGAAAQAVSLLLAYESQGTKWYTLFTNQLTGYHLSFILLWCCMWLCANEKQGKSGIYIRGESADPGKISLYA